jgi:apolipoprotein N-acyltransferase
MNLIDKTAVRYLLAGISGLLAAAAFPDLGWWPLILLAPPVLMLALRGAGFRHGLYLTLVHCLVCYGVGLAWFTRIFGPGAVALWLIMAAYALPAGGLIGWASLRHPRWPWLAMCAALWLSALEFVRAEVGWLAFPWFTHGLGLGPTWLSPWIGVYGAGFVVVLAGALVVFGGRGQRLGGVALGLVLVGLGCFRPPPVTPADPGIPVLAVQSEHCDFYRYVELTENHPFANGIILWPEYAAAFDLATDAHAYSKARALVQARNATLILGTQQAAANGAHFNHALTLEPSGPVGSHFKNHPVPFMNDGLPGTATVPAATRFGRIGTPICFDCDYVDVVRRFTVTGAEGFAVPSMDAAGWSATQHAQHAELFRHRALENGRWLVVCATSGMTQLIDANGNRRAALPLLQEGVLETRLHLRRELTFFTRCGWLLPWLVCGLAILATAALAWREVRLASEIKNGTMTGRG